VNKISNVPTVVIEPIVNSSSMSVIGESACSIITEKFTNVSFVLFYSEASQVSVALSVHQLVLTAFLTCDFAC
jgi:hypothetical protein